MEYKGDGDGNAHIEIHFKHFEVVSLVGDHELCTQAKVIFVGESQCKSNETKYSRVDQVKFVEDRL